MLRLLRAQAVRLAHGGHGDHLDREVEVLDHPPDEQQLLGVLLAVVGAVGAGEVQQLADDGQHAVEVPGPGLALEHVAERAGADPHARVAVAGR